MTRRLFDILVSAGGLAVLALPLAIILFLVWWQDGHSPFYVADRVGTDGKNFRMIKIRSMIINADKSGVESTGANDSRITDLGHFIRRWKLDELSQLWNVLKGDMSLVGPRPNTANGVADYSAEERRLLSQRPGITDFSSIVFSDEGEILKHATDPDAEYDRLIRPWKSKLGLIYVDRPSLWLNIKLIAFTVIAVFNRDTALKHVAVQLEHVGADTKIIAVALRDRPLSDFA